MSGLSVRMVRPAGPETVPMSQPLAAQVAPRHEPIKVRIGDLGLARENLRYGEAPDDEIPRLAETIRAAGLLYPPIVRKGRKGESRFMVLDGRRRRYALLALVEDGALSLDDEVQCLLARDRVALAQATVIANTEHAAVHPADVIVAIGKLRRSRLETGEIAKALGYDELEIKRLEALSGVHPNVLKAFRMGRLTLTQVRLFARLGDRKRQDEFARAALAGCFYDYPLQALVRGGRVTIEDTRFALVGRDRYLAAGGRLASDLFGELPEEALDPELLTDLWMARAKALGATLEAEGLDVHLGLERGYRGPEGLLGLPRLHSASLTDPQREALDAARDDLRLCVRTVAEAGPSACSADPMIARMLGAALAEARAIPFGGGVAAALLTPDRQSGLEATFFVRPAAPDLDVASDADDGDEEARPEARPEVEVPVVEARLDGLSHGLHERRTDLATRGLIRDLADQPAAALTALVAQLFKHLALHDHFPIAGSALAVSSAPYGWGKIKPVERLDGEVRARLAARREAYLASGLRPIGWVDTLPFGERMSLLAELVAVSLNLRESRTTAVRPAARAEAAEIAALCGADLAAHWSPDVDFLAAHPKALLLSMLQEMGEEHRRAGAMKKADLAGWVAEAAAARRWAPAALGWGAPVADQADPAPVG